jgi:DNA-binding transcriptional MerR regulator
MDFTVGQLAKQCGLSVRSLHHYEAIGLLVPSRRSESGYRLYSGGDVQRLHRILAYRQLGVSLKDIEKYLGPDAPPLKDVLARQRDAAEHEAARLRKLISLLDRAISSTAPGDEDSTAHQLIELMNTMQSIEKHFSTDEQKSLEKVRDQLTPAGLENARKELGELLAGFKSACENNVDVNTSDVAKLARRWRALGAPALAHPELRTKTRTLLASSAEVQKATGVTPALMAYIDRAVASLGD